ncbi:hypothetical protein [Nonomuraea africana]|uniref:Uncharacterized protein n=1 Tax=Nonomuraea africana TaxID=46171 RepID=A0ABR9KL92_9ACTN|nr:hypothetical protein [Nonomuraea africana]MBE1562789.1 hypothetical protein [Nonomuraea africana]
MGDDGHWGDHDGDHGWGDDHGCGGGHGWDHGHRFCHRGPHTGGGGMAKVFAR